MKISEIHLRDPFILTFKDKYYLYGTSLPEDWDDELGFWCYESNDLENWSEPIKCFSPSKNFWGDTQYWAPEVHYYKDAFYMFASFYTKDKSINRATQILKSNSPIGPFEPWSQPITPKDWMCLDGTFYVENDTPYMVFCHEWLQVRDGEICVIQLSNDLKTSIGTPKVLFKASEAPWCSDIIHNGFITDGPFLYRATDGKLLMIWSSFNEEGYVEAVSFAENGSIYGEWKHCEELFFDKDGGHGMIFEDIEKNKFFLMHRPNYSPNERPVLFKIKEINKKPFLKEI